MTAPSPTVLIITTTHTVYFEPPAVTAATATGIIAPFLPDFNFSAPQSHTFANYFLVASFIIFVLAVLYLGSYVLMYLWKRVRWRWKKDRQYAAEHEKNAIAVGESAGCSEHGSFERFERLDGRRRSGLWWATEMGVKEEGKRARFSGAETEREGRGTRREGRRMGMEV